jgi:hypothetical protein
MENNKFDTKSNIVNNIVIPVVTYTNIDKDKSIIITENKSRIYR